jgi:hypothetical protein
MHSRFAYDMGAVLVEICLCLVLGLSRAQAGDAMFLPTISVNNITEVEI